MSKILYFSKFNKEDNPYVDIIENQIYEALKKCGHKVVKIDAIYGSLDELKKESEKADYFLFHNGGVETDDEMIFLQGLNGLKKILEMINCRKVFWFMDRVVGLGEVWMDKIIPLVDYGFLNDDTWVRRHKYPNVFGLHLATERMEIGKKRKEYECDVALIGRNYGLRTEFINELRQQYGRKFKVFENVWGQDFSDVCASAKVIVESKFPMTDFCWTNHIYRVLMAGGFLINPRLHGLKEEGFDEGTHYACFNSFEELLSAINFFLKPEVEEKKEELKKQAREFVMNNCLWENRVEEMFNKIKEYKRNHEV